ncbi:MAG: BlaI/MecI/CopY family transcriptional regulator [Bacteroidetes bacterium]|nr:BlaI/MecI/CopY family transcriptional regulator [Bacteroidota bacterium]
MKELTKAEEQVMQILWEIERGFIKDIIEKIPAPKPAYNTISTIVRILEKKGFVGHKAYGKTHEYYPLVSKEKYTKGFMKRFVKGYFSDSYKQMVSFFSKDENLDIHEMEEMLDILKKEIEHKKNKEDD